MVRGDFEQVRIGMENNGVRTSAYVPSVDPSRGGKKEESVTEAVCAQGHCATSLGNGIAGANWIGGN